jgi:hypothetical protein
VTKQPPRADLGPARTAGAPPACTLCGGDDVQPLVHVHGRAYFECTGACGLIFMAPADRLTPDAERARYALHRNDAADVGYRAFLDRLCAPLSARLPAGARGLDYGSGPGPTLSVMLRERGFPTDDYDPFFAPDPRALERTYDFITCTETAEHFAAPAADFARLDGLLAVPGWLALMTEVRRDERDFAGWWYVRDPTHVSFYRPRTFAWIATAFGWTLESPAPNVALFRKGGRARR